MFFETDFKVIDSAKIAWILQSIKSDRELVSVAFSGGDNALLSAIIDVDRKNGCFSIDAFVGSVCHDLALAGEAFEMKCSLNGVEVTAKGLSVQNVVEDSDGPIYIVPLPEQVRYLQRRNSFRARVTGLISVPVQVTSRGQDGSEACFDQADVTLSNLSAEGCRLEISGTHDSFDFESGQSLALTIHIPEQDPPVQVNVDLCHKRLLIRSKLWYVGCQFVQLDAETQRIISQFVVRLQTLERKQEEMFIRN